MAAAGRGVIRLAKTGVMTVTASLPRPCNHVAPKLMMAALCGKTTRLQPTIPRSVTLSSPEPEPSLQNVSLWMSRQWNRGRRKFGLAIMLGQEVMVLSESACGDPGRALVLLGRAGLNW